MMVMMTMIMLQVEPVMVSERCTCRREVDPLQAIRLLANSHNYSTLGGWFPREIRFQTLKLTISFPFPMWNVDCVFGKFGVLGDELVEEWLEITVEAFEICEMSKFARWWGWTSTGILRCNWVSKVHTFSTIWVSCQNHLQRYLNNRNT